MSQFEYTPDDDVRIHEAGAIKQICTAFLSHESGLPEWLKNSADAYVREDAPLEKRVIIVFFDFGRKNTKPSISCLDFSGMTSHMIETYFRFWASPDAAKQEAKNVSVQGGHGNGGKCYMTQMFKDHAFLYTVKNNKGNIYGVRGGEVRFGYIPNKNEGRDFYVNNLEEELEKVLSPLRCSLSDLPEDILKAINIADGFTLVKGVGPIGYDNKIPVRPLQNSLQEHIQMIRTLELCKVYVFVNGKFRSQITLPQIPPIEGEEPREIPIPEYLIDPNSGEKISTTNNNNLPLGNLILRTSSKSMRTKLKGRHNISFKAKGDFIGYVGILELGIQSPWRDHIYGECYLDALEPYKQNERARLANSPLRRAVEHFIAEQIEIYAKEFEEKERHKYSQIEKNELSKMNEALDRWKNKFLTNIIRGTWGHTGPIIDPPPPPPLPTGKPAKLELTLSHLKSGVGVSFKPNLKFFDKTGQRIRQVPFKWVSEDNNVAMVDEDLMIIDTYSVGQTQIYAETIDGKIKSNKVPLEVVHIHEIQISPKHIDIHVGSKYKLEAICRLSNGEESSDVYLEWIEDNPNFARVSSAGMVFGLEPGMTQVTVGDDNCEAREPAIINVLPAQMRGAGDQKGLGFAKVLISEVDPDPDTGETVFFPAEYPPIWQRPIDYERKIWWINSAAPLARMYLDTNKGYGYNTREWRMYLVERYIDIMVQIALTHSPETKESIPIGEWILKWGEQASEIQILAASSLSEFIKTGKLPEE
ncbi:MAG: hypothetical protein JRI56_07285 [Deltaproteobacteria bacterium]|nr:hypothetical protein [Deltaproteobacteria bacterium]